jgi:hypothetical protein
MHNGVERSAPLLTLLKRLAARLTPPKQPLAGFPLCGVRLVLNLTAAPSPKALALLITQIELGWPRRLRQPVPSLLELESRAWAPGSCPAKRLFGRCAPESGFVVLILSFVGRDPADITASRHSRRVLDHLGRPLLRPPATPRASTMCD